MSDIRINVNEIDRSQVVQSGITEIGAMVVRSARGSETPKKFFKGNESAIVNYLGFPSKDNPDVQEVIDFNKEAELWVSAPNKNGLYGGVIVTPTGIESFYFGRLTITRFLIIQRLS